MGTNISPELRARLESALLSLDSLTVEARELRRALDESVALQSHYANVLNAYNGGQRMRFPNADAWIARLRSLAPGSAAT